MKQLSLQTKILFKALERTRFGRVNLTIADGQTYSFGEGDLVSEVYIQDESVLSDILKRGDVAFGEAIANGVVRITDEARFILWACQNDDQLRAAFHGTVWGTLWLRVRNLFKRNTISGAKRNIMAHYDLGNDFYKQWLDPSMSYSSALFSSKNFNQDLQEAQLQKYDRIIEELEIKPGDHVLEVGCGWGGFFTRAIEKTGCKVTAVQNSPAQAEYNKNLIARKGMQQSIDLKLMDYRQISGRFDKVVSIEMVEAVGEKYWPTYFAKISDSLRSGGKALIQSITIREDRFQEYRRNPDFINSYIFPGGMLLTNSVIESQAQSVDMSSANPFEFGLSYAETLKRWRENFGSAIENGTLPQFDEKFLRLWNFYLSYCEGAFMAERINVGHYLLAKD